jgi:hypothetical protein
VSHTRRFFPDSTVLQQSPRPILGTDVLQPQGNQNAGDSPAEGEIEGGSDQDRDQVSSALSSEGCTQARQLPLTDEQRFVLIRSRKTTPTPPPTPPIAPTPLSDETTHRAIDPTRGSPTSDMQAPSPVGSPPENPLPSAVPRSEGTRISNARLYHASKRGVNTFYSQLVRAADCCQLDPPQWIQLDGRELVLAAMYRTPFRRFLAVLFDGTELSREPLHKVVDRFSRSTRALEQNTVETMAALADQFDRSGDHTGDEKTADTILNPSERNRSSGEAHAGEPDRDQPQQVSSALLIGVALLLMLQSGEEEEDAEATKAAAAKAPNENQAGESGGCRVALALDPAAPRAGSHVANNDK